MDSSWTPSNTTPITFAFRDCERTLLRWTYMLTPLTSRQCTMMGLSRTQSSDRSEANLLAILPPSNPWSRYRHLEGLVYLTVMQPQLSYMRLYLVNSSSPAPSHPNTNTTGSTSSNTGWMVGCGDGKLTVNSMSSSTSSSLSRLSFLF